ncbi:MAG: CheY-like chemotaxis protein/anti-sigma regulatory factor (Ser/Thr protein kinase) [bacterium]|jgi:CheY-like chemotaxis protein/anti-sigma regulatory factor (Ser/Thr protein kinase)
MQIQGTLLVVDNNLPNQKLLSLILGEHNIHIISATTGAEALNILEKSSKKIDMIILEWMLPGMDGLSLLRKIKDNDQWHDLPVLMVTTQEGTSDIREGIEAGAYYYMRKPFDKDQLLSLIRNAMADHQEMQDVLHRLAAGKNISHTMNTLDGTFYFKTLNESYELAQWIAGMCPDPERAASGLVELLRNAIEHGNLGLTYDEKTRLIIDDSLDEELLRRLRLPENRGKQAKITLSKSISEISIYIEDQGKGFNYSQYLELDEERVFDNHGRGIAIAKMLYFDEMKYLGSGNIVEVKYIF